jgi:hypothetical protein
MYGAAAGAYNSTTPEQRQQMYGAAAGAYNSATPEQRQRALNGAVAVATSEDVFV